MKVMVIQIVIGMLSTVTSEGHPNYCMVEIVQNTEKSPGDLRILAVTQSSVKDH